MIDLGSFLASHKSTTPFKPPKQKGAHPPSGNPLMYLLDGGGAEKWSLSLATFLKQKQVLGA
jgi:hypothetical protein